MKGPPITNIMCIFSFHLLGFCECQRNPKDISSDSQCHPIHPSLFPAFCRSPAAARPQKNPRNTDTCQHDHATMPAVPVKPVNRSEGPNMPLNPIESKIKLSCPLHHTPCATQSHLNRKSGRACVSGGPVLLSLVERAPATTRTLLDTLLGLRQALGRSAHRRHTRGSTCK